MEKETYRKCPNCGTMNLNRDYCSKCGTLVNTLLRRKLERKEQDKKRDQKRKDQKPNVITLFFEKALNHKNVVVRILAKGVYSIWALLMIIGGAIAYIIGYIAA